MQHGAKTGFIRSSTTFIIKMSAKVGNPTAEVLHVCVSKKTHQHFCLVIIRYQYSMRFAFGPISCKYC